MLLDLKPLVQLLSLSVCKMEMARCIRGVTNCSYPPPCSCTVSIFAAAFKIS